MKENIVCASSEIGVKPSNSKLNSQQKKCGYRRIRITVSLPVLLW
jgi:hypothetical protein